MISIQLQKPEWGDKLYDNVNKGNTAQIPRYVLSKNNFVTMAQTVASVRGLEFLLDDLTQQIKQTAGFETDYNCREHLLAFFNKKQQGRLRADKKPLNFGGSNFLDGLGYRTHFVLYGMGSYICGDSVTKFKPGDLLILEPNEQLHVQGIELTESTAQLVGYWNNDPRPIWRQFIDRKV